MSAEFNLNPIISRRAALLGAASFPVMAFGLSSLSESSVSGDGGLVDGKFYRIRSAAFDEPVVITCEKLKRTNGAAMELSNWNYGPDQIVMAKKFNDGSYSFIFPMKIYGGRHALPRQFMAIDIYWETLNAQLWEPNSSAPQRFVPIQRADGSYELVSSYQTDKCLTAIGGGGSLGKVGIRTRGSLPSQSWYLEEYGNVETFSNETESTRFSGLETNYEIEDHNPIISLSGCTYIETQDLRSYQAYWDGCGGNWMKLYAVDANSSLMMTFPTVGTYYGDKVGVREYIDNIVPYENGKYSYGRPVIGVCDVFSGQDPAGIAIGNIQHIDISVEFFYTEDSDRKTIDIDWCYWSCESLSNGEFYWEWVKPELGWTGGAYCLPGGYAKFGQPCMITASLESMYGDAGQCYTGCLPDKSQTYEYESVSLPFSGKRLSMQAGCARTDLDDKDAWGSLISNRFRTLAKSEKTPVHFMVYDPVAATEDASYSPLEIYQEGIQKGTVVNSTSDTVKAATAVLEDSYPGAVTADDYWWATKEFKDRFSSVTVKSDAIFIWAKLSLGRVEYYSDGTDTGHLVYTDSNVRAGDYAIPDKATKAALAETCNLNEWYGSSPSTGFTGWFLDASLDTPANGIVIKAGHTVKLYGRNRCTVRFDYTEDSFRLEEGMRLFSQASDSSDEVPKAIALPDFAGRIEEHRVDGLSLPAIGDDGDAHLSVYCNESLALSGKSSVYQRMEDGTWRRLKCDCYLTDKTGGDASEDVQDTPRHHALYQMVRGPVRRRHEHKEVNIIRDGGAASVPRLRMSLAGGALR